MRTIVVWPDYCAGAALMGYLEAAAWMSFMY
jgi:hypothetical protein